MKLKKSDEMEMAVNFKAMRMSWVFVTVALMVWLVISYLLGKEYKYILLVIICVQNILFFGSKIVMTKRMSKNNDEE